MVARLPAPRAVDDQTLAPRAHLSLQLEHKWKATLIRSDLLVLLRLFYHALRPDGRGAAIFQCLLIDEQDDDPYACVIGLSCCRDPSASSCRS